MTLGIDHPAELFKFFSRRDAVAVEVLLGRLDRYQRCERCRLGFWLQEGTWLALRDAPTA